MANEPRMTGIDKEIFNATRTLTSLLNDACNHWNYLCPYLEKLAGVADDALRGYQKDYPEQVAELIDYRRECEQRGDAAAMRETLVAIRKALLLDSGTGPTTPFHIEVDRLTQAALSAPARNCDMYDSYGDAIRAFEDTEDAEDYEEMAEWLFAPATEKEGEGDGR